MLSTATRAPIPGVTDKSKKYQKKMQEYNKGFSGLGKKEICWQVDSKLEYQLADERDDDVRRSGRNTTRQLEYEE